MIGGLVLPVHQLYMDKNLILFGGDRMFGLISKSEHKRICDNLHSHIDYFGKINRQHCEEIESLNKQLELENRRATYWKMRFLDPDNEPVVIGSQEAIEYIKQ